MPRPNLVNNVLGASTSRRTLLKAQNDGTPVGTVTTKSVVRALAAHSSITGAAPKIEKLKPADTTRANAAVERAA